MVAKKDKLGTIAIVGRPNVGKSTLFNRFIKMRKSIVDSVAGVTRDRIYGSVSWLDYEFSVIDTGGFRMGNAPFQKAINEQVEIALEEADVVVFVVNFLDGVHPDDLLIARKLHKASQPVLLVANKYDSLSNVQNEYDFYQLGLDKPHLVSAAHGIGIGDLLETIVKLLPRLPKLADNELKIGLIGCPNVGKSTLLNSFLGEERSIVSAISGTTRDPVDSQFTRFQKKYLVYDTAGIRRKSRVSTDVEYYAVLRAIRTLEKVDLVLLILDSTQAVSEQEKTIGALIAKFHKPVIIVSNKWDAVASKNEKTMQIFKKTIYSYFPHLNYAPLVFISALKNRRLHHLFKAIELVEDNFNKRIPTALLNRVIQETLVLNNPPLIAGKQLKIFYVTQLADAIGTFVLFVNDKKHAYTPYLRYLENEIRNQFGFIGIPIKLILNNRRES